MLRVTFEISVDFYATGAGELLAGCVEPLARPAGRVREALKSFLAQLGTSCVRDKVFYSLHPPCFLIDQIYGRRIVQMSHAAPFQA